MLPVRWSVWIARLHKIQQESTDPQQLRLKVPDATKCVHCSIHANEGHGVVRRHVSEAFFPSQDLGWCPVTHSSTAPPRIEI